MRAIPQAHLLRTLRPRITSTELRTRMADRIERVARRTEEPPMQRVAVPSPHGGWITVLQELPLRLNQKR